MGLPSARVDWMVSRVNSLYTSWQSSVEVYVKPPTPSSMSSACTSVVPGYPSSSVPSKEWRRAARDSSFQSPSRSYQLSTMSTLVTPQLHSLVCWMVWKLVRMVRVSVDSML